MSRTFASGKYLYRSGAVVTAEPITAAAWVYPTSLATENKMVWEVGSTTRTALNAFYLHLRTAGVVGAGTSGSSYAYAASTSNISTDVWSHIAGVWASTSSRAAYLNGASKGTNTTSITSSYIDQTVVGANYADATNTWNQYFVGSIAEVSVWNVVLTDAEIAALAKGFSPRRIRPASLVAYWPLGGHFGQADLDRWKNRYDLTASGSPTWADHPRLIYPDYHLVT